jgi:exodeoxyribonuclease VII small subunit
MGETKKAKKKFRFEDSLSELETIAASLDSGELSLEQMLVEFERGVKLVRECRKFLDEAQKRVEALVEKEGDLEFKELETPGPEEGDEA